MLTVHSLLHKVKALVQFQQAYLIILFCIFFSNNILAQNCANCWFNSDWQHGREVVINNTNNSDTLTDFQVKVELNTQSLINAGKMQPNGDDIRFTTGDCQNTLCYAIDSGMNTANTVLWVKANQINSSSKDTIYMFFGNPSASSGEDKACTYEFYDGFEDGNTNNWTDNCVQNGNGSCLSGNSTGSCSGDYCNSTVTDTDTVFNGTYSGKMYAHASCYCSPYNGPINEFTRTVSLANGNYVIDFYKREWANQHGFCNGTGGHNNDLTLCVNGNNVYNDGSTVCNYNNCASCTQPWQLASGNCFSISSGNATMVFSEGIGDCGEQTTYLDDIRIRKCASPQPTTTVNTLDSTSSTAAADSISIAQGSNPVCSGTNLQLTVNGGNLGAGADWQWYKGTDTTSNSLLFGDDFTDDNVSEWAQLDSSLTDYSGSTLRIYHNDGCCGLSCPKNYFKAEYENIVPVSTSDLRFEGRFKLDLISNNRDQAQEVTYSLLDASSNQLGYVRYYTRYEGQNGAISGACGSSGWCTRNGQKRYVSNGNTELDIDIEARNQWASFNENLSTILANELTGINSSDIAEVKVSFRSKGAWSCPSDHLYDYINLYKPQSCATDTLVGTGDTIPVSPTSNTVYNVRAEGPCDTTACQSITISVNDTQTVTIDTSLCQGQSYFAGGQQQTTAGTYYDTLTAANNCDSIIITNLTIDSLPTADASADKTICQGDSATLTASGGTSYTWSTGKQTSSITVSPTNDTTYTVTVTDTNSCTATDTVDVIVNQNQVTTIDTSICEGESYLAGGQSQTTAGTYYDTLTTGTNCDSIIITNLSIDSLPPADAGTDKTICQGDSAMLNASGGTNYNWNTGDQTASITVAPINDATYTVTVTDTNSCSAADTVDVEVGQNKLMTIDTTICQGESYFAGGQLQSTSGTYYDTLSTVSNCDSVIITDLTVDSLPIASANATDSVCLGNPVFFTDQSNDNPVQWQWTFGDGSSSLQANPSNTYSSTGSYEPQLVVTNSNGCQDTTSLQISVVGPPDAAFKALPVCKGDTTFFSAQNTTPGNIYSWDFGTGTSSSGTSAAYQYNSSGSYTATLVVTNQTGCADTNQQTVQVDAIPNASFTPMNGCPGESLPLDAIDTSAANYEWQLGDGSTATGQGISHTYPSAGTYAVSLVAQTTAGCTDSSTNTVTIYDKPNADAGTDQSITQGESAELNASGGTTYQWAPTDGLTSPRQATTDASPEETTTYQVEVTDTNNCSGTDTVQVKVEATESEIAAPNAFSPNGDGLNDTFKPKSKGVEDFKMKIFNRWGEKVFESNRIDKGWEGHYKGSEAAAGTYVYTIYVTFEDGRSQTRSGSVTLIR